MKFPLHIILSFVISSSIAFSQGGGESAAEASVTGSASQPVVNPPDSSDSNPIVTVVRLGIPVSDVVGGTLTLTNIVDFAQASGSLSELAEGSAEISKGTFAMTELTGALNLNLKVSEAKVTKTTMGGDYSLLSKYKAAGTSVASVAQKVSAGTTLAELRDAESNGLAGDLDYAIAVAAEGYSFEDVKRFLDKGISADKAKAAAEGGLDADELINTEDSGIPIDDAISAKGAGIDLDLTSNSDLLTALNTVIANKSDSYALDNFQTALTEAVTVADTLLTDRTITSDLPDLISVASLGTGYNYELARLLVEYGAIGETGSALANTLLGSGYTSFTSSGSLTALSSTSDYLSYLSTLTGSASFGDVDATSSVLSVPMSNVFLAPGSTITLGASGSTSTINVSNTLTSANGQVANRKILVIGAAKDLNVAGDVVFTNSNTNEDHALAIGAADNVEIINSNISYDAGNLGIGSGDSTANSMFLVNTAISAGGNLAVGSLGTLTIDSAVFSIGTANEAHFSNDNAYLYANDLIQANNLEFTGRVDDVYMEAITINLQNVAFPSTADVMLRSRDGSIHFGTYSNPTVGGVNMTNVSHGGTTLQRSHFDGVAGHHDSSIRLPNGTAAVKVRKQY